MLVLDKSGSMASNTWGHDRDAGTPEVTRWASLHQVVESPTPWERLSEVADHGGVPRQGDVPFYDVFDEVELDATLASIAEEVSCSVSVLEHFDSARIELTNDGTPAPAPAPAPIAVRTAKGGSQTVPISSVCAPTRAAWPRPPRLEKPP